MPFSIIIVETTTKKTVKATKKVFIKLLVIVVENGIIPTEFATNTNPKIELAFQKNS